MIKKATFIGLAVLATMSTAVAFYSTMRYRELVQQDALLKKRVDALEKDVAKVQAPPRSEIFEIADDPEDDGLAPIRHRLEDLEAALKQLSAPASASSGSASGPASGTPPAAAGTPAASGSRPAEEEVRKIIGSMFQEFQDRRSEDRRKQVMEKLEKELNLTAAQKEIVTEAIKQYREQVNALFEAARQPGSELRPSREERQQQVQALQQQAEQKVLTSLTYPQQTKYQELKASGEIRLFGGGWGDNRGPGRGRRDQGQNR